MPLAAGPAAVGEASPCRRSGSTAYGGLEAAEQRACLRVRSRSGFLARSPPAPTPAARTVQPSARPGVSCSLLTRN